ncbi:MAG: hypothetical protein M1819_006590 [Sarea resinae]|nr:MAG: hypothetical protein M1819_006590 [Sarea resinae]
MPSGWTQFPLGSSASDLPPLLVKSDFCSTGYSIFVTDLDYIWTESLDRRQIFKRALNENTSIDPSEDPSQMRILLEKIQAAIQGDEDTDMILASPEGPQQLVLKITAPLPAPLSPLEWTLRLELHPKGTLQDELILPLLSAQIALSQRSQSLMDIIREKDHVIARLVDKLEASGTDLGSLFPGAAGLMSRNKNKGSNRETVGRVVRGLGNFDEEEWSADMKKTFKGEDSFGDTSSLEGLVEKHQKHERTDKWWEGLGQNPAADTPRAASARTQSRVGSRLKMPANARTEGKQNSDEEFQRQKTPPNIRLPEKPVLIGAEMQTSNDAIMGTRADSPDETTDEEDDLEGISAPASRRASDPTSKIDVMPKAATTPLPLQPKKRLGTLGGRSKANVKETAAEPLIRDSPAKSSHNGKLGVIGGKSRTSSEQGASTPDRNQLVPKEDDQVRKVPANEESEETPQDRANRRREQLRRELEERSKAPPKKKRRF